MTQIMHTEIGWHKSFKPLPSDAITASNNVWQTKTVSASQNLLVNRQELADHGSLWGQCYVSSKEEEEEEGEEVY